MTVGNKKINDGVTSVAKGEQTPLPPVKAVFFNVLIFISCESVCVNA